MGVSAILKTFLKRDVPQDSVPPGQEQPPQWYDHAYSTEAKEEYANHYTRSTYYFLWTVIADRMPPTTAVLEIGCGPGQFAQMIADRGGTRYLGFDFSREAIQMASKRCPSLNFHVADALTTDLFKTTDYQVVICTEVLEHIQNDLQLLSRIRPGVRCLITVPNFPYVSHVRHFCSDRDVTTRYRSFFSTLKIDWLLMNEQGNGFFLLDGIKNSHCV